MISSERASLPLRQNCEGYFLDKDGNILAQPTKKGYMLFPGGGIKVSEDPTDALMRETLEETGARVRVIKYLGSIQYEWPEDWAKTEKQKKRYEQYRGDEIHFFSGMIDSFTETFDEEDSWQGNKLMPVSEAIEFITSMQPFPEELAVYYSAQLTHLKSLE